MGEILTMGFFDVFLPTLDVYGDASLMIPWYYQGHYVYASLMTVPMVLNYLFTTYKWWSVEKASDKKWSWILVMLQLWQQWNALKVIRKIYKKDNRAEEQKKKMLRELSSIEPFFESVPSILIMTCIWMHAFDVDNYSHYIKYSDCANTTSLSNDQNNFCAVFDGLGGPAWFFTTYAVSILAGSLGICKFLQNGPVAILPSNMMNWPLVRAYFAILFALLAKALFAAGTIGFATDPNCDNYGLVCILDVQSTPIWLFPLIFITINIVPNLILSVIGISLKTGWNKTLIKTLLDYPAFIVLPAFTNFCVGPPELNCSRVNENSEQHLTISGKLTAINTGLTVICYGMTIGILSEIMRPNYVPDSFLIYWLYFSPILIISCLCIIIFYRCNLYCCKCCINCCCSCCCKDSCLESRSDVIDKETVS